MASQLHWATCLAPDQPVASLMLRFLPGLRSKLPLLALALSSCATLGPEYQTPEVSVPANYKEQTAATYGFRSDWWTTFQDPELTRLQRRLLADNLGLSIAIARRDQAFAALGISRANQFPSVTAEGSIIRSRASRNTPAGSFGSEYETLYQVTANVGYELDLWGRVRRLVEASRAEAEGALATIEDVRVALQTQLARNYFALRFIDAEAVVLREGVKTREESLDLAQSRFDAGFSSALDTARAQAELSEAKAELLALKGQRAQLENSIAVLVGANSSQFSLAQRDYRGRLPIVPSGLPAGLLSRRPDIAVAERQLAAETARIGVAEAEFFPRISLTGGAGRASINTSSFLDASSRVLSIGPSVSAPIFTGGRLEANLEGQRARQREALSRFQQTVLQAFADVESALASVSALREETAERKRTVSAAETSFDLAKVRYDEGTDDYLTVIDAQRALLQAQRAEVRTRAQQFSAAVQLIQALGGGYSKRSK